MQLDDQYYDIDDGDMVEEDNDTPQLLDETSECCYDDSFTIDNPPKDEPTLIVEKLHDMLKLIKQLKETPTDRAFTMRTEFSLLCKEHDHVIRDIYFLKKLVEEIDTGILETETIVIKNYLQDEQKYGKPFCLENSSTDAHKWSRTHKRYAHVLS